MATGSIATAATAAALLPVAVVAAPAYYLWRRHAKVEDRERIEGEFRRRQLAYAGLAGKGRVSGSQFFPIVPNPQTLVFDYRVGGESHSLEVRLDVLSGLHVAPTAGGGAR